MAVLDTTTKTKIGARAGKTAAKNPRPLLVAAKAARPVGTFAVKASKPFAKRRMRQRAERLGDAARTIGETLVIYGPPAAYELGLAEPPKPKRTAPRVAVGIVIGASAVYFLEPEHGREHREKVAQLVS
jgi:hypothetical protein